MSIPIFEDELKDGLAEEIRSSASIAYCTQAKPLSKDLTYDLSKVEHPEFAIASKDQWDLFCLNSVLVSVGWNRNDDVFDVGETWAARNSPINKPFNFMHNEKDIIGHMTASVVTDFQGNLVTEADTVPDKYEIVVASVLYKKWADAELQERMDGIIEGISQDEWFVSMECLFRNFDYAIISPDGEHQVVPRNETSAFLTKHLRIYGGTGEFEGNRLGRLLRGFTFSGKGLVDNPANPRSIIFNNVDSFAAKSSVSIDSIQNEKTLEKQNMTTENTTVETQLRADLAKSEAKIDKLADKLEGQVEAARKSEQDKLEKQIASLKVDVEFGQTEVSEANKTVSEREEAIAKLEKELKDVSKELTEAKDKMDAAEADAKATDRVSQLVSAGVDKEQADEIVSEWSGASDEQFENILALHTKLVAKFPEDLKKGKKDDKDDKDKKDKKDKDAKADSEVDENEDSAEADLDDVDTDEEAALAAAESGKQEELRSATASWIAEQLTNTDKE